MILADTSAWVEFDRNTGSAVDVAMAALIADGAQLAVSEPILMEVLAGARDAAAAEALRRLLLTCHWLALDSAADFDAAASIYRTCRRSGITPRGLIDCLIAAVARRHGAAILTTDADLRHVAGVVGIVLHA